MRRALLWFVHFIYWLRVHRGNFSNARWATDHEMGAWNK
jgi:hypothetical protein